jgi:hypothetical protein
MSERNGAGIALAGGGRSERDGACAPAAAAGSMVLLLGRVGHELQGANGDTTQPTVNEFSS